MSQNNVFPDMKFNADNSDDLQETVTSTEIINAPNFVLVDDNIKEEQITGSKAKQIEKSEPIVSQEQQEEKKRYIEPDISKQRKDKKFSEQAQRERTVHFERKVPKKELGFQWKTFLTAMSGALAGCLLFLAIFQGGNLIFGHKSANGFNSSSSLVQSGGTVEKTNLMHVVDAVSPGVVTVLINKQQRTFLGGIEKVQGLGSGVVYHRDGDKVYIITNTHVVEGASEIAVYRNDLSREELDIAKVQDYDTDSDIAVLIVNDPERKYDVVIDFANSSELVIGQEVIAVGSPMGEEFSGSVTTGIISGLNRQIPLDNWGQKFQSFIQTDAAINGGNSGGGLIDTNGRLVGINSAKLNNADNIGLAIPSNTVLAILEKMNVPQPKVTWEFENENIDKTAL